MQETTKTAFITGFTGQDGTFLTKHLLEKGYKVVGLVRRISTEPPRRVRGKFDFSEALASGQLVLEDGDLQSISSLIRILGTHQPLEVYNLAWQSHVGLSFKIPEVSNQDYQGFVNLLTALEVIVRMLSAAGEHYQPRVYQASTSEMFGDIEPTEGGLTFKMTENTPLNPNSPYAIAKTAAHHYAAMKRKQGFFISSGILFNHESEIRGGDFVTQKIVRGAVAFKKAWEGPVSIKPPVLELGNLASKRDWGYAGDYVKAMHKMLEVDQPGDFIIGTGETRTVQEFVESAFDALGLSIVWSGVGREKVGRVGDTTAVAVNPEFYRPNDVGYLCGESAKAWEELDWAPETPFNQMVKIMVDAELERVKGA